LRDHLIFGADNLSITFCFLTVWITKNIFTYPHINTFRFHSNEVVCRIRFYTYSNFNKNIHADAVFKYNPPAPFTHSVYLLPNPSSYEKCDVKKGKMIASPKQGAGKGFEFVLKQMKPYYISCGEHDGAHCSNGTMKFTVMPMLPRW